MAAVSPPCLPPPPRAPPLTSRRSARELRAIAGLVSVVAIVGPYFFIKHLDEIPLLGGSTGDKRSLPSKRLSYMARRPARAPQLRPPVAQRSD